MNQKQQDQLEEQAYRRGYSHGVAFGYHTERYFEEIREDLKKWRFDVKVKEHPESKTDKEGL